MGTGTSIFGPTRFYPFTIRFSSDIGLSGLQVLGQKLPMQDSMFVVPKLSSVTPRLAEVNADMTEFAINITVAVSRELATPSRQIWAEKHRKVPHQASTCFLERNLHRPKEAG